MDTDDILEVGSDVSFDTATEVDNISEQRPKKFFILLKIIHCMIHMHHIWFPTMKKEFPILLVQIYQDVIRVIENITVAQCLHFSNLGEEGLT